MSARDIILIGMAFLFLSGISFAGCSYDAFKDSCNDCTFDAYGKMDEQCWKGYQSSATTCLGKKYPMMSVKYMMGDCPQVDDCASKLTACKDAANPGSNLKECKDFRTLNCFIMADDCVVVANDICANGKTEDEAGWGNVFTPQPLDNLSEVNVTQNVTTVPEPDDRESALTIMDFICPENFIILLGTLIFAFRNA